MQKNLTLVGLAFFALAIGSSAQAATLIGAKTILVTNAASTTDTNLEYIQVGEVVATQALTGTDVALASNGTTATATSQYSSFDGPDKAIDGIFPADYYVDGIYHSGGNNGSDVLTISLASPFNLSSLTIYGRADGCCEARDIYGVQILNASGVQLYKGVLNDTSGLPGGPVTVDFAAVPEPATWAMLLLGFGAIGWTLRGQRKSAVATA